MKVKCVVKVCVFGWIINVICVIYIVIIILFYDGLSMGCWIVVYIVIKGFIKG